MKIGTLTLRVPTNYGNALQTFSLHKYLLEQGFDAVVLNKWGLPNEDEVRWLHRQIRTFRGLVRFFLGLINFSGMFCQFCRERKLRQWLYSNIRWSREQGYDTEFPVEELDCDTIVVGSDQVWNPMYPTLEFYLLGSFPDRIKKIAYAASLGTTIPPPPHYKQPLEKFLALSVRESSACQILHNQFGIKSTLVCDPTLLHTREEWCRLLGIEDKVTSGDDLVMYLVTYAFRVQWRDPIRIARQSGKRVHCYVFTKSFLVPIFDVRHPFSSIVATYKNIMKRVLLFISGVRLHFMATPTEFVRRISQSGGLITDSFHGMMFATIFGKPCNVVVGTHPQRVKMSARLHDFLTDFGDPSILTAEPDVKAMKKIPMTQKLTDFVTMSKKWLLDALSAAEGRQ